jgi:gamma-glutamylaminecyclotransferase
MRQLVFVYGTLLRGDVNHHLISGAEYLGPHRTAPCFALYLLGAYPGAVRGGMNAIVGEVYSVDRACLRRLDRLEDYPRLYDRRLLGSPYGRAWIYLYRGPLHDRPMIPGGDWRAFAADPESMRAAGVRRVRDSKTRGPRPGDSGRNGATDATHTRLN